MSFCTHVHCILLFCCHLSNCHMFHLGVCISELPQSLVIRIIKVVCYDSSWSTNTCEEDWSEYIERLSIYFTTNVITGDDKKWAILLSSVGLPNFHLMQILASLDSFSYNDVMSKVKTYKEPAPSVIVRCFQFNTHNKKTGESIAEYIDILCKAAEHCNYSESLIWDTVVWEKFNVKNFCHWWDPTKIKHTKYF